MAPADALFFGHMDGTLFIGHMMAHYLYGTCRQIIYRTYDGTLFLDI